MGQLSKLLMLLVLAAGTLLSAGCAGKVPPAQLVRVAVLDGVPVGEAGETRRTVAGWWMGSRDRFEGGNAGIILGEALASEFDKLPGVQVHSRTDLAVFLAQKERTLKRAFPDLSPEERYILLQEQDPLDYGRSLNVDYVLTSQVYQSRTTHNRTFHWWVSRVTIDLAAWDVATGEKVWAWKGKDSDMFSSQMRIMEELSREASKAAAKRDVFKVYRPSATPPAEEDLAAELAADDQD